MRIFKTILTVLILAAALGAGIIALYWEQLLTPEQKLEYGLVFSATEDYAARARLHPESAVILEDYVNALVITGNLGRAAYLCKLHGVANKELAGLRTAVKLSLEAAARDEVYPLSGDPAVKAVSELPAGAALRYLEAYQHALLGDWVSARNIFAAIDERQLAPALRPYLRYYLARSYRLVGNAEEKSEITGLLQGIITDGDDSHLVAKARYNLIAWYLSDEFPRESRPSAPDPLAFAKDQMLLLSLQPDSWAAQKSYTELAAYHVNHQDFQSAWEMAQAGMMAGPEELSAKRAGELVVEILTAVISGDAGWGMDADGALIAELEPQIFTNLARWGARHGTAAQVAPLLDALKPHVKDRERWEELRVGLAICYHATDDISSMRHLMADANLRDLSDASLAGIYFRHALLLEQHRQWNPALDYFKSCVKLGGPLDSEANFHRYAIIKRIQDPLDLNRAVALLTAIVEDPDAGDVLPKAVEELIPLLIHRGDTAVAQQLAHWAATRNPVEESLAPEQVRSEALLAEVANYWEAYLAGRAGNTLQAGAIREHIPCRYWNYYELTSNYPPRPELATSPTLLAIPESAGEYLAGLGLTAAAAEFYAARDEDSNPCLQYLTVANRALTAPLHTRQWHAGELLESGMITEQALLDYVLAEAYPRPYPDEVAAAADEFNISENLIWAVMKKESNFRPDARSWVGAHGLMQVMEPTARWLNGKYGMGINLENIEEPAINIRLGAAYLASQYEIFGAGKTRWVIHAYNGGDGNLRKWRDRYGSDPVLLTELIPNEENEGFGKKVTRYFKMYEWLGNRE